MSAGDIDAFVAMLYDRFATSRGLIGTPETCLEVVRQLSAAGVDEIACLLDFGPSVELILNNLPHLLRLKELWTHQAERPDLAGMRRPTRAGLTAPGAAPA